MSVTLKPFSKTFDTNDYPQLNRAQFSRMLDTELQVFLKQLFDLDCDWQAQQDLTKIGVATKFWTINEYSAVRQVTHYTPQDNSIYVRFDAVAILKDDQLEKLPGEEKPTSSEAGDTTDVIAAPTSIN